MRTGEHQNPEFEKQIEMPRRSWNLFRNAVLSRIFSVEGASREVLAGFSNFIVLIFQAESAGFLGQPVSMHCDARLHWRVFSFADRARKHNKYKLNN